MIELQDGRKPKKASSRLAAWRQSETSLRSRLAQAKRNDASDTLKTGGCIRRFRRSHLGRDLSSLARLRDTVEASGLTWRFMSGQVQRLLPSIQPPTFSTSPMFPTRSGRAAEHKRHKPQPWDACASSLVETQKRSPNSNAFDCGSSTKSTIDVPRRFELGPLCERHGVRLSGLQGCAFDALHQTESINQSVRSNRDLYYFTGSVCFCMINSS